MHVGFYIFLYCSWGNRPPDSLVAVSAVVGGCGTCRKKFSGKLFHARLKLFRLIFYKETTRQTLSAGRMRKLKFIGVIIFGLHKTNIIVRHHKTGGNAGSWASEV